MLITTQDNSVLNLDNYDSLELVYKRTYNKETYRVSAIIFDEVGHVVVEAPICEFGSKTEADTYLDKVEKDTSYIRIPESTHLLPKSWTLLNLARFNTMEVIRSPGTKKPMDVKCVRYSEVGAVLKTKIFGKVFMLDDSVVEWLDQLAERMTT